MSLRLPRDLRGSRTYEETAALLRSWRGPGVGRLIDATDLASRPDGSVVAFTGWLRTDVEAAPSPTIGIFDAVTGAVHQIDGTLGCRAPRWSPDGRRMLCLRSAAYGSEQPLVIDMVTKVHSTLLDEDLRGTVEWLDWSPDGSSVAMLVAEPGAEISDVYGSGRVPGVDVGPGWLPQVADEGRSGWRRVWLTSAEGGASHPVPCPLNVWELCWAGPGQIAAVASPAPMEDSWYDAELVLIATTDGSSRTLFSDDIQLALPASDRGGRQVSVLSGTASDRGLVAGELVIVDIGSGQISRAGTDGVHVTSQVWCDDRRVLVAGLRGQDTVLGHHDTATGRFEQLFLTRETFGPGDLLPAAVPYGECDAAVVLESHARPPTCGIVREGRFHPLVDLSHPGADLVKRLGTTPTPITWSSADGLRIDGYVLSPAGRGPHPLVVLIHGGPVWCWRDVWSERVVQAPLLLRRGFAVLLPNPRGSQGRGESFVRAIIGEVGGLDTDDILTGVDAVVAAGIAERSRVAVMGTSYGGFLAAWLATCPDRFAAALASSPVTDWVSQHYTTNIPQSDVRFLRGHPRDPTSDYGTRSPINAVSDRTAPLLLTAGSLDLATPPSQALEMHRALLEAGRDTDIAIYPEEGHDVHGWPAVLDHCTRMLLWFEHFLT